jgi:hypothetical protein
LTAHCTPVLVRFSSCWICGTAIDTMVWSMKVIATAKIMAVRTRFLFEPLAAPVICTLPQKRRNRRTERSGQKRT